MDLQLRRKYGNCLLFPHLLITVLDNTFIYVYNGYVNFHL